MSQRVAAWCVVSVAVLLGLAAVAAAAEQDCSGLLPDLRCDRVARYPGFVSPLSAPYRFEEPFVVTGLSAYYIHHDFPDKSVLAGGSATVYALQARVALTERLAFIATKDGYMEFRPDLTLLDDENAGWTDLTAGFKYALVDMPDARFILSPSLRYQTTQGSNDVLAGNGEGIWIPGVSFGWGPGPVRILGSVAAELPLDGDANSQPLFWNLHVAVPFEVGFTPFVELNGIHYMDEGDGSTEIELINGAKVPIQAAYSVVGVHPEEGFDVRNLGANGVKDNDVVSFAVGARMPLSRHLSVAVGWEHPVTKRKDLLQNRLYLNLTWELSMLR